MVRVVVGVLLLLSLLAPSLGQAGPSPQGTFSLDKDGDGLHDALQSALAGTLAVPTRLPPNMQSVGGELHYGITLVFDHDVTAEDVARLERLGLAEAETFPFLLPDSLHGWAPASTVRAAVALDGVRYVEWDIVLHPALSVSAAGIRARSSDLYPGAVWETFNVTGEGVAVAVLDTGIDDEHPMLAGKVRAGFDATIPTSLETGPLVPLLYERNPDDDSDVFHGTHVAGIVAGGATDESVAGVAPDATLVDVKILTPAGGTTSLVKRALEWLAKYNAGQTSYGTPEVPVRIASLSVQGYDANGDAGQGDDQASLAINSAFDKGILTVVAAGNCGPTADTTTENPQSPCPRAGEDTIAIPGVAARALTVAALDDASSIGRSDDTVAGYSSRGPNGAEPKPNLAAPGTRIESAAGNILPERALGGTKDLSGTSMAAPHVSGAAALLMEANPALTVAEVRSLLLLAAEDRGEEGWDPAYGHGLLDAYVAATQALRLAKDPRANAADEIPPLPDLGGNGTLDGNTTLGPAVGNEPPVAKFTFSPTRAKVGKIVTFTDDSSDPDGRVVERHWSFGDGSTSGEQDPRHIYARPGEFLITLRVVDDRGGSKTAQAHITVVESLGLKKADSPALEVGALAAVVVAALWWARRRERGA